MIIPAFDIGVWSILAIIIEDFSSNVFE
jgi:hypothetical protein